MFIQKANIVLILPALIFAPLQAFSQISNDHPFDEGIENHPDVLYVEKFDDGLDSILSRYSTVVNGEGMSLENDCPEGLSGGNSLKITSQNGLNTGGYLYKHFPEGFDNEIYLRYYVKYPEISKEYFHHEGIWLGGYKPALEWPYPRAGICGLGDTRFSVAYEIMDSNWIHPYTHIAPYVYWGDMRSFPDGACWGNFMQCGEFNRPPQTLLDEWTCVEIMIRLNSPPEQNNGELKTWINGVETGHWGKDFPAGSWVWGNFFTDPEQNSSFEGFRWRTQAEQLVNYIWIQFYHDHWDAPSSYVMYDNVVLAKKYIGPVFIPTSTLNDLSTPAFKIFPNPASQFIYVTGHEPGSEFFITDLQNRLVLKSILSHGQNKICTAHLMPGIYFLNTWIQGSPVRNKLVIQPH